ncbi:MAG: 30S ribosomal protein S16 [Phycisphaeraceae bacterium]|nr:30S ribosomal protein S16 [Phycisphaeraceae bacterium]
MVKLRLKRFGRRHRPYYRVCVMDQRSARNSSAIEELGYFDPIAKDPEKELSINAERAKYWLSVGAQPSDTVRTLLRRQGILESKK